MRTQFVIVGAGLFFSVLASGQKVTVSPATVSLYASQQQTFVALMNGSPSGAVTWTISPAAGTIAASGLYTAPALIPSAQTVTVTATRPNGSATATISLVPVSISVSPSTASLNVSQTQLFTASITGTNNTGVNWSLNPQVGTLLSTSSGGVMYTAPNVVNTTQTIELDGVSVSDSTKIAKAFITLVPVVLSMTPSTALLLANQTQQFTANITGTSNTAVNWSVQPSVGSIDVTGIYTAPSTVLTAQNITVTAQSVADRNQVVSANLILSGPPSLSPTAATLAASQTQQFTYAVGGTATDAYWSLSPSVGTISRGLYTAPALIPSAQSVTITAMTLKYGTVTATVNLIPVGVSLGPSSASVMASQAQQFTPTITGTSNTTVTWSLNPGVGTLSSTGLYTAPALIPSAQTVAITATSAADPTKSSTVNLNLTPVVVSMTPLTVSLSQSQTQSLAATVTGSTNTGVTWSTPSVGTLVTSGTTAVYASPSTLSTAQTVPITVTSMADTTKSATSVISLASAVVLSLAPATANLYAGQTQQFTANVTGTGNTAVTWSLNPSVGTIDSTGFYTAPGTVLTAQNVTVTAQSVADPTKSASSTASIQPGIQWSIDKNRLTSLSYGGQSFYQYVDYIAPGPAFRTPTGTLVTTPWTHPSTATLLNPTTFQQVYNLGQPYQFTLTVAWTQTDSRTLKAVAQVTNNDPVNTLVTFNLGILAMNLPGAATQYNANIPIDVNQYNGMPVQFLSGTWGSVAVWQSGYPTAADQHSDYGSATQTVFANTLTTSTGYGPRTYSLETSPGQTSTLTQYIRFGSTTETATSLAPEAYAEYRSAFPDLVNWPDRRPIANWFISDSGHASIINPRGYLWDPTIDVTQSAFFQSRVLSAADNTISILNGMSVKPQGIIIWDLEGQEFKQPFTYVGYPNQLPNLAPEMDAIADAFFAKFTAAGYRVGVTVRPHHFGTGTTLPPTCATDSNYDLWDKFILVNAAYPYRGYQCWATNTWAPASANGPSAQTTTQDYNQALNLLQQKITYAHNRWGATLFYIDTSIWEGGASLDVSIFRTLATQFPDSLFIPEITNAADYGATAPYNWSGGNWNNASRARSLYPGAFQVMNVAGIDLAANYTTVLQMVEAGDILLFRGWLNAPEIPGVQQIYAAAGFP